MTVEDLIVEANKGAHCPRAWIRDGYINCYIRVTKHAINGSMLSTLDLANIEVAKEDRGKGFYTEWLTKMETLARDKGRIIFHENVLNERLEAFLVKRGYTVLDKDQPDGVRSYYLRQKDQLISCG